MKMFKTENIAKFFYSFIGPIEHNKWWGNSRNGSFEPKNSQNSKKIAIPSL